MKNLTAPNDDDSQRIPIQFEKVIMSKALTQPENEIEFEEIYEEKKMSFDKKKSSKKQVNIKNQEIFFQNLLEKIIK